MTDGEIKMNRHITNTNEIELTKAALELSKRLDGTDIVIIAGGKDRT